jgi:predicted NodU family carbamoyl transferase
LKEKLFQKSLLKRELKPLLKASTFRGFYSAKHHLSHAASAFYPSPYDEAIVLTIDGADVGGTGIRQEPKGISGDPFSAFTRTAVLSVHLLHSALRSIPVWGWPPTVSNSRNSFLDVN